MSETWISKGHAKAFKEYFDNTKEKINEVLLDRNGLDDESASVILKGFSNKMIKKLTLASNELGKESIVVINEKLAKYLQELRMCHLKISRPT